MRFLNHRVSLSFLHITNHGESTSLDASDISMDAGLRERLKFPRLLRSSDLQPVGLYNSTLDPSGPSSPSFKRGISNSHARAFERCHHLPSRRGFHPIPTRRAFPSQDIVF